MRGATNIFLFFSTSSTSLHFDYLSIGLLLHSEHEYLSLLEKPKMYGKIKTKKEKGNKPALRNFSADSFLCDYSAT